jgi:hypothetical protein
MGRRHTFEKAPLILIFIWTIKVSEAGIKMRLSSMKITPKNILLALAMQADTL